MHRSEHKVKRILTDILFIVLAKVRLKSKFYTDPHIYLLAIFLLKSLHCPKIRFRIERKGKRSSLIIFILMVGKANRLKPSSDCLLYHCFRFKFCIR